MGSLDALTQSVGLEDPFEFILLGTGTSATLPHVDCLTRPSSMKPCRTCLQANSSQFNKNRRANTSAVARVRGKDGELKTIVIDVGKSFNQAAVKWFPKYGLRRIDAVLITHAHADAMNGLDDLRGWTLGGAIQPYVDLYVSQDTYEAIGKTFPYLVQNEFASGGGDVPKFRWHIIDVRRPFEIGETGIVIKPFAVPHGLCGAKPVDRNTVLPVTKSEDASPTGTPVTATLSSHEPEEFMCLGYIIQDAVTYISDVSRIPDDVMDYLLSSRSPSGYRPPVLILDCLNLRPHRSHLSLSQSVQYARQLKAQRTYLVGFSHEVSHEEYTTMLQAVGGLAPAEHELTDAVKRGLETLDLNGERIWIRPGYDGLRVIVSDDRASASESTCRFDAA